MPKRGMSSEVHRDARGGGNARSDRVVLGPLGDVQADRRQQVDRPGGRRPARSTARRARRSGTAGARHRGHEVGRDRGQSGDEQHEHGDPIRRDAAEGLFRVGSFISAEIERRPRVLERAQEQLHRQTEARADRIQAEFVERHKSAEDVAVDHGDDLVRDAVRHARQAEAQRLPQDLAREHEPDERHEPSRQHEREDRRDHDVGEDDAQHAELQRR